MLGLDSSCVVALPVHNGEEAIGAAIASVRAQTGVEMRCVVRLNGCTDGSEAAAIAAIGEDQRFNLVVSKELVGPGESFRLAAQLAGEVAGGAFTWLAAGDEFAPRYLSRALETLNADPQADWVVACTRFVDGSRRELSTRCPSAWLRSENGFCRLLAFACQARWNEIYAVFGSNCRADVEGIEDRFGFDAILTWRLLLRGSPALLGAVGTEYELSRELPPSMLSRVKFRWRWACSERELRWGSLWIAFYRAAANAPSRKVAWQARLALIVAALHPRWVKRFTEHMINATVRRVRRLGKKRKA